MVNGNPVAERRSAALNELRPLVAKRAADEVAEQIRHLIVSSGLHEGDRLPSERQLAESVRSSRATVSQAIRTLAMLGLVEVRRGSGAYVTRNPATVVSSSLATALQMAPDSAPELAQLRFWLERTAALEVQHAQDAVAMEEIESALGRLERSIGGSVSEHVAADTLFHATIVRNAGNTYLDAIYESVHTAVVRLCYTTWIEKDIMPPWRRSDAEMRSHFRMHEDILRELRSSDVASLDAALHTHHEMLLDHLERVQSDARRTLDDVAQ
jgi:GntR family transcriptional regulator, transcriptional repressor for pyruvate dehydrogenase complex